MILTTCIEGFFDFPQFEDVIFFYGRKKSVPQTRFSSNGLSKIMKKYWKLLSILIKLCIFIRPDSSILQINSLFGILHPFSTKIFHSPTKNVNFLKKCRIFCHFTKYEKSNHKYILWQ